MIKVCMCQECGTVYEAFCKACPNCGEKQYGEMVITEEEYQQYFGKEAE